jgi:hypothetical protein
MDNSNLQPAQIILELSLELGPARSVAASPSEIRRSPHHTGPRQLVSSDGAGVALKRNAPGAAPILTELLVSPRRPPRSSVVSHGTLIIIALIVIFFAGRGDGNLKCEIEGLRTEIVELRTSMQSLQAALERGQQAAPAEN